MKFANGNCYEGDFKNEKREGKGVWIFNFFFDQLIT